eukprot:TRINITY_DN3767_c0_g1_i1.p1 TRINITY_DN3767_c0_g1~~TRINITY_DN3767_c0_g1_i1.p1  ORF type:complete len:1331 (+),score=270.42 TRINITY_DN3767_c0_g1_i1:87-4079(+)
MELAPSPYLEVPHPQERVQLRLLCFPHSGGGPSAFSSWAHALDDKFEVVSVSLPGRERRVQEPPIQDLLLIVREVVNALKSSGFLAGEPYAVFGHSFGSLIAFEVIRELAAQGLPLPVHFFPSGHGDPTMKVGNATGLSTCAVASSEAFLDRVAQWGGLPQALRDDISMSSAFLPALRADLSMYEKYQYHFNQQGTAFMQNMGITALGGVADPNVPSDALKSWSTLSMPGCFRYQTFAGGHFYMNEAQDDFLGFLNRALHDALSSKGQSLMVGDLTQEHYTDCIQEVIFQHPPDVCNIEDSHETIPLGELKRRSDALAASLIQTMSAFGHHERELTSALSSGVVGVLLEHNVQFVVAMLAIWRANACLLVFEAHFPEALVLQICEECAPSIILTDEARVSKFAKASAPIATLTGVGSTAKWNGLAHVAGTSHVEFPRVHLESPAYLVFTSGTTGKPKTILMNHASCIQGHCSRRQAAPYEAGEKEGCNIMFVWEVLRGLLHGANVFCIPDNVLLDPSAFLDMLGEREVTRFLTTPSVLRMLLGSIDPAKSLVTEKLRRLKLVTVCGEVLTKDLVNMFARCLPGAMLANSYSTWESGDVLFEIVTPLAQRMSAAGSIMALAGSPVSKVACAVVDPVTLMPVPAGVSGELYVGGLGLSSGYFGDAQTTQSRFLDMHKLGAVALDLLTDMGGRTWYKTGDRAVLRKQDHHQKPMLEILGRMDDTVKIRGFKVSLPFVEAAISAVPGVKACVVKPVLHSASKQPIVLVCWFVPEVDILNDDELIVRVRTQISKVLPSWSVPGHFRRAPDKFIQGGESKKLNRKAIPVLSMEDLQESSKDTEQAELQLTPMQKKVADAWSQTLRSDAGPFTPQSDFYLHGGSLDFAQLAKVLQQVIGVEVPVKRLLNSATLAGMADVCTELLSESGAEDLAERHTDVDVEGEAEKYLKGLSSTGALAEQALARYGEKVRKSVLLTGSSGFVGAFVLRALCMNTAVDNVVCIVRGKDTQAAQKRLLDICREWFSADGEWAWFDKVICLTGDVAAPQLGLSTDDYDLLAARINVAMHIAAEVNMVKPYAALAQSNVGGTANLLDLCARAGGAPIVFTSTIAPLPTEEVTGYRRSKEVAEVLLSKARLTLGVPSSILQIGDIGMSSRPGSKLPDSDYIVILLRACIALGLRPEASWVVNIVGIEPLADHMVHLAVEAPAPDFAAVPVPVEGSALPWSQLCNWVSEELPGGGFRPCTLAAWRKALTAGAMKGNTAMQQVQLLLPGIEAEFEAKAAEVDMVNGIGHDFTVDEAWCRTLGKALAKEADGKVKHRVDVQTHSDHKDAPRARL